MEIFRALAQSTIRISEQNPLWVDFIFESYSDFKPSFVNSKANQERKLLTAPLAGPVEDFHLQVIRVSPNTASQELRAMPGALKKGNRPWFPESGLLRIMAVHYFNKVKTLGFNNG